MSGVSFSQQRNAMSSPQRSSWQRRVAVPSLIGGTLAFGAGLLAQAFAITQASKICNFNESLERRARLIEPTTPSEKKKYQSLWEVQLAQWERVQRGVEERLSHYNETHQKRGHQQLRRAAKYHRGGMLLASVGFEALKIGIITGVVSLAKRD